VRYHRILAARVAQPESCNDASDGIDFKNPFTMSKTDASATLATGIAGAQ